jgi:hypothetical protein
MNFGSDMEPQPDYRPAESPDAGQGSSIVVTKKARPSANIFVRILTDIFALAILVKNLLTPKTKHMEPTIIISGFAAALKAVETWLKFRDSQRAAREFEINYAKAQTDASVKHQAVTLKSLIPAPVLNTMGKRTQECWDRYHVVLKEGNKKHLPSEIDDATQALKACLCRELRRIYDLNGTVPEGDLSAWWNKYCGS